MNITHLVDLESLAGIEVLFKDLYSEIAKKSFKQSIILPAGKIHSQIKNEISEFGSIYSYKEVGNVPIPSIPILRNANLNRVLKKEKTEFLVIWNRLKPIGKVSSGQIYYEHSTAWYEHDKDKAIEVFSNSRLIVTVSNAAKRFLELTYGSHLKCPIKVLHNPLPLSRSIEVKRKESNKIRLGFAGHFIPRKAPWVVLHVLKGLVDRGYDAEAYFAGKGVMVGSVIELAKKLGISERCHFLGSVKDMPEFYSNLDYLLVPSISETFGLSPLEAAFQGTLPIVSSVDGLTETYSEFKNYLTVKPSLSEEECAQFGGELPKDIRWVYNPDLDCLSHPMAPSPEEFVKKICFLEDNKEIRVEVSQTLKEKVKTEYSFTVYTQGFLELLEGIHRA